MAHRLNVANIALVLSQAAWLAIPMPAIAEASSAIPLELTGTVLDRKTKQPLEGAYVLAIYQVAKSDVAWSRIWCIKTRGMYTGADGRFSFPMEKLDGLSPHSVSATKPDYTDSRMELPHGVALKQQDAAAYADRVVFLSKQDPAKPDLHLGSGEEVCDRPSSREDAAAATQFLRLQMAEMKKYGALDPQLEAARDQIRHFESLPSKNEELQGKK